MDYDHDSDNYDHDHDDDYVGYYHDQQEEEDNCFYDNDNVAYGANYYDNGSDSSTHAEPFTGAGAGDFGFWGEFLAGSEGEGEEDYDYDDHDREDDHHCLWGDVEVEPDNYHDDNDDDDDEFGEEWEVRIEDSDGDGDFRGGDLVIEYENEVQNEVEVEHEDDEDEDEYVEEEVELDHHVYSNVASVGNIPSSSFMYRVPDQFQQDDDDHVMGCWWNRDSGINNNRSGETRGEIKQEGIKRREINETRLYWSGSQEQRRDSRGGGEFERRREINNLTMPLGSLNASSSSSSQEQRREINKERRPRGETTSTVPLPSSYWQVPSPNYWDVSSSSSRRRRNQEQERVVDNGRREINPSSRGSQAISPNYWNCSNSNINSQEQRREINQERRPRVETTCTVPSNYSQVSRPSHWNGSNSSRQKQRREIDQERRPSVETTGTVPLNYSQVSRPGYWNGSNSSSQEQRREIDQERRPTDTGIVPSYWNSQVLKRDESRRLQERGDINQAAREPRSQIQARPLPTYWEGSSSSSNQLVKYRGKKGDQSDGVSSKVRDGNRVSELQNKEDKERVLTNGSGSGRKLKGNEMDGGGAACPICLEPWTSDGDHSVCCLPCGHLYGMSCIKNWLEQANSRKCPQCNEACNLEDIRRVYGLSIGAKDKELQEKIKLLEAKCASLELKDNDWQKKEAEWRQREVHLRLQQYKGS